MQQLLLLSRFEADGTIATVPDHNRTESRCEIFHCLKHVSRRRMAEAEQGAKRMDACCRHLRLEWQQVIGRQCNGTLHVCTNECP